MPNGCSTTIDDLVVLYFFLDPAARFRPMPVSTSICVITGATEGIGRAIAFSLGRRGATLAVCARTAANVNSLLGDCTRAQIDAIGMACDVADEQSVSGFARFVLDRYGNVDVLVNNAGVGYHGDVEQMSVAEFDETMAVNIRGVFLMTRAFLPGMKARGHGHIVNIASLAGKNAVPGGAAYSASKHAVLGFSKSLLLEVRRYGIRVMTICPGSVVTAFFEKSGLPLEHPDRKLQPEHVAEAVAAALDLPATATISDLDIRPANP